MIFVRGNNPKSAANFVLGVFNQVNGINPFQLSWKSKYLWKYTATARLYANLLPIAQSEKLVYFSAIIAQNLSRFVTVQYVHKGAT